MKKAILLQTNEIMSRTSFTYYVDPPLENGYPNDSVVTNNKKSRLIDIIFHPMKDMGMVMEVWLLDELGKTKDHLSFEYYHHKMKEFNPEDKNPEPFLKFIGYDTILNPAT